jgi:hypothetical protein
MTAIARTEAQLAAIATACRDYPNPIIRETPLRAYPGWIVRTYTNGMIDATNGLGLTGGSSDFAEVVAMVREDCAPVVYADPEDEPVVRDPQAWAAVAKAGQNGGAL